MRRRRLQIETTFEIPPNPFGAGGEQENQVVVDEVQSLVDEPRKRRGRRGARVEQPMDRTMVTRLSHSEGTVHVGPAFTPGEAKREYRRQQKAARDFARSVERERTDRERATSKELRENKKNTDMLPAAGEKRPQALRTYRPARAPAVSVTADVASIAYPFLAEAGLGSSGTFVGTDSWSGSAFVGDPWSWYERGFITNPNMALLGVVGMGKSMLAKSWTTRGIALGYQVIVACDPKGEWTAVAKAVGGQTIELGVGSVNRLNPLDAPARRLDESDEAYVAATRAARLSLVEALAVTSAGRDLRAIERTALEVALDQCVATSDVPLLGGVVERMLDPRQGVMGATVEQLRDDGREVGHALRRLVEGDLKGLFDGPSTVVFDASMPMVTIDMSAISGSDALIAMVSTCAAAFIEGATRDPRGGRRYIVYDEAWRLLREPALIARMQEAWKLARARGVSNLLILHRLSDMDSVGDEKSEARGLAQGLLADCSIKIVYKQEHEQALITGAKLGLTDVEVEALPKLTRGEGLWRVGERSFLVRHRITPGEATLFNTDVRMAQQ